MTQIRTSALLKSKQDLGRGGITVLDARIVPFERTSGKDLKDLIMESVNAEHTGLLHEFPSELILTEKQFASLNAYTEEMLHTTDRMFVVLKPEGGILCLMEVIIDDTFDTVDEIDFIKRESEEMLSMVDFTKLEGSEKVITPANFKNKI